MKLHEIRKGEIGIFLKIIQALIHMIERTETQYPPFPWRIQSHLYDSSQWIICFRLPTKRFHYIHIVRFRMLLSLRHSLLCRYCHKDNVMGKSSDFLAQ